MIQRALAPLLVEKLKTSKLLVLRGPKRSGKMRLLQSIMNCSEVDVLVLDAGKKIEKQSCEDLNKFHSNLKDKAVVIIREAQLLSNLQDLVDLCLDNTAIENMILLCSFEPVLQSDFWEALRAQQLELSVLPISYAEAAQYKGLSKEEANLEKRLIYGYYPEIVEETGDVETILYALLENSVFTQLGAHERINKKDKLIRLLRLLSFHIGKVISFNDLGKQCGLDNETVERYVKLFEKADLLFVLSSFNNGHRYELKKSHVVYFVDNGIRNALIRAFQPVEYRNDIPELWRNWVLSERRKANILAGRFPQVHFWLTHTKQEVDYLEVNPNGTMGYKMQWDKRKQIKVPASFEELYPQIKVSGVNRSTFWSFIQKK